MHKIYLTISLFVSIILWAGVLAKGVGAVGPIPPVSGFVRNQFGTGLGGVTVRWQRLNTSCVVTDTGTFCDTVRTTATANGTNDVDGDGTIDPIGYFFFTPLEPFSCATFPHEFSTTSGVPAGASCTTARFDDINQFNNGQALATPGDIICTVSVGAAPVTPPTINSLQVTQKGSTNFTGINKVSGLTNVEGGSNWLNGIRIRLNATSNPSNIGIKQAYVGFYQSPSKATDFYDLRNKVNNSAEGFLLGYGVNISGGNTAPSHFVYIGNGNWQDIGTFGITGYNMPSGSSNPLYTVFPGISVPNSWSVKFYEAFGYKNMFTAVYVVDNNNSTQFIDEISPQ